MRNFVDIRKNSYYDSVLLMLITKEIKKLAEVGEVLVGMGTDLNRELALNLGLSDERVKELTPNDFFIAATLSDGASDEKVLERVNELLNLKKEEKAYDIMQKTFSSALNYLKDANLAIISLPGKYAAYEAEKALYSGLNVMLFSDNVTIEEELMLKKLGRDKGLLVMGPDCGTAIINQVPLCFANVVRKGNIGIVGASGTGTQEVSVIIDRLGGGISQVIGTGGRDLKPQIGGIMMMEGFKALIDDPETKVIVLISKPPAQEVAEKILELVKNTDKPVLVNFIGGDREQTEKHGAYAGITLEDTAHKAVNLSKGLKVCDFSSFEKSEREIDEIVIREISKLKSGQKYLRALYTGGTLADEAMKLLSKEGCEIYSNIPLSSGNRLKDINKSIGHTCIDLGEDDFTVGKPHPMIDPSDRAERLLKEVMDPGAAIILMDFVLGYGSNADPAGEMLPSIFEAKRLLQGVNRELVFIGYICGTDKDPQNFINQKEKLEGAGVVLMPSNAQAVRLTARILEKLKG